MSKTKEGLIAHCKTALKNKVQYIYGAKMTVMSYSQIKALQNMYGTSYVWVSDLNKAGKLCCDCSGLISSYTGIARGSTNYKDTATTSVSIATLKANWSKYVGWGLWMQGHIGVVSDTEGYYYAMDGSGRNMVHYPMSKQSWTKCIKLCDIDYTVKGTPVVTPTPTPVAKPNTVVDANIKIEVVGKTDTYKSKNVSSTNYVQARPFLVALGYTVGFNNVKSRVMANSMTLDVPTIIENGTAFIHLRDTVAFINKYDNKAYNVGYNATTRVITVK